MLHYHLNFSNIANLAVQSTFFESHMVLMTMLFLSSAVVACCHRQLTFWQARSSFCVGTHTVKGETKVGETLWNVKTYWNITQVKKEKTSFVQVIYVGAMSMYKQYTFSEALPFTAEDGDKVHLNVKHMIVKKRTLVLAWQYFIKLTSNLFCV